MEREDRKLVVVVVGLEGRGKKGRRAALFSEAEEGESSRRVEADRAVRRPRREGRRRGARKVAVEDRWKGRERRKSGGDGGGGGVGRGAGGGELPAGGGVGRGGFRCMFERRRVENAGLGFGLRWFLWWWVMWRFVTLCMANLEHEASDGTDDDKSLAVQVIVIIIILLGGTLVIASVIFIVSGFVVATQWPNPSFCCWIQSFSDRCGDSRRCCSLYHTNMCLVVVWLVVFVFILLTSRYWQMIVLATSLMLLHATTTFILRRKFSSDGWPQVRGPVVQMVTVQPNIGPSTQPFPFLTAHVGNNTGPPAYGQPIVVENHHGAQGQLTNCLPFASPPLQTVQVHPRQGLQHMQPSTTSNC